MKFKNWLESSHDNWLDFHVSRGRMPIGYMGGTSGGGNYTMPPAHSDPQFSNMKDMMQDIDSMKVLYDRIHDSNDYKDIISFFKAFASKLKGIVNNTPYQEMDEDNRNTLHNIANRWGDALQPADQDLGRPPTYKDFHAKYFGMTGAMKTTVYGLGQIKQRGTDKEIASFIEQAIPLLRNMIHLLTAKLPKTTPADWGTKLMNKVGEKNYQRGRNLTPW